VCEKERKREERERGRERGSERERERKSGIRLAISIVRCQMQDLISACAKKSRRKDEMISILNKIRERRGTSSNRIKFESDRGRMFKWLS